MKRWIAVIGLMAAGGTMCHGQAMPAASEPGPRYEVFGGYSLMRGDMGTAHRPQGWAAGFTTRFNPYLGVDASLVGNVPVPAEDDGKKTSMSVLMFGPRLSMPLYRFTLSANAGAGLTRWQRTGWNMQTMRDEPPGNPINFAWEGGIGADFRIFRNVSLRLIQADYLRTRYMSGMNGVFTTGIVYGFGKR